MKLSLPRRCLAGLGLLLLAQPNGTLPTALAAGRAAPGAAASALPRGPTASALPPGTAASTLPPVLAKLVDSGKLQVVSQFATEVPDLTGYIVHNSDGTQVVYGEHGYLFIGHVISPQGADLTDDYRQRYTKAPDFSQVVQQLDGHGHLIEEGRAGAPLLYVFADPNCSFCYRFYKMAEPLVASGKLRLRWVMVAFLQSSSAAKATAILSARDPRAALHADEDRFDTAHEAGGIEPARTENEVLRKVLQAHMAAMDAVGGIGTPTLLYRDEHGHWGAIIGLPQGDWLTEYAAGKHVPPPPNG